jgi:ornithine cyclodeaminase
MGTLIVNRQEVRSLLPMEVCIDLMTRTFESLARGECRQPLRQILWQPDCRNGLGLMPGFHGGVPVLGCKLVSVFPGNAERGRDSHQGVVALFDTEDGRLLALVDGSEITRIRTAAVSAVATRHLSNPEASHLALLGTGVQAESHLEAMRIVAPISRVTVWSSDPAHAREFVERNASHHPVPIDVASSAQRCVDGAELICTVTAASEPVLEGAWIARGAHINAVGACVPAARELDSPAVKKTRLFVDSRESAHSESGDFRIPREEDWIDDDHIQGELGELLVGSVAGRNSPHEITLFKSLGLAVEDLAAAHLVYRRALEQDAGVDIEIGGLRE